MCGWMMRSRSFDKLASCDTVCSVWPALVSVSIVAWVTLAIATLTCSTAVVCCLVESSISRAASVVVDDEAGDLLEGGGHVAELPRAGIDRLRAGLGGHHRGVHRAAHVVDQGAHLLGRAADAVGELADLVGDHGEALAGLAGAGRLDRGVDGEDVGLLGELGDDVEHRADLLRLLAELEHVRDDLVDLAADAGDRLVRHVDRAVAGARRVGGLLGDVRDALRALGDLARGRQQLADRGGDLGHRGGLLLGAARLLVGGGLQLGRGAAHLADGGADLLRTASCEMNQPMPQPRPGCRAGRPTG